jgi:hypothetical protein
MPSIVANIARIEVGGESLVSAAKANELIDAINALRCATIAPSVNVGVVNCSSSQVIYDFALFDNRLKAVESGMTSSNTNITNIENRLANVTINGSGTCSGNNISITVNINI